MRSFCRTAFFFVGMPGTPLAFVDYWYCLGGLLFEAGIAGAPGALLYRKYCSGGGMFLVAAIFGTAMDGRSRLFI